MTDSLVPRIKQQIGPAGQTYHKLILVVGPSGCGKSTALKAIAAQLGTSVINAGLHLSGCLVGIPPRQRPLRVQDVLSDAVRGAAAGVTLLDNTELLFASDLRLDPLGIVQSLSRNCVLVVSWAGCMEGDELTYAEPGHPEYRRYLRPDAIIVSAHRAG